VVNLFAGFKSQGKLASDMIEKTISEIEAKISGADSVNADRKQELLKLLGTLKSEIAELSKTHGEQADSIAGFAQLSAHEAMRTEQNPQLRELSLQGLRSSVADIEQSHPHLAQIVNSISKTLSDLGI
jgi:Mg2+ and Co2+ transporter CorA